MSISDTLQCVCSVTCVGSPASTASRLLSPVADLLSSCLLSPLSSLLPPLCCRLFVVSRLLMFPVSPRVSPVPVRCTTRAAGICAPPTALGQALSDATASGGLERPLAVGSSLTGSWPAAAYAVPPRCRSDRMGFLSASERAIFSPRESGRSERRSGISWRGLFAFLAARESTYGLMVFQSAHARRIALARRLIPSGSTSAA